MPWDFPNGPIAGAIFEPNGAGTSPSYTWNGAAWDYGATTELLISSVVPNSAICGSPLMTGVRALGYNFTATTEVLFDGNPAANIAFVSVSEMTFDINPVPETVPRTAVITVRDGATIGIGAIPFNFAVVTTIDYRIGIDETSPGIVDVLVANTKNEIGGVTVVPRSDVQGLELDLTTGALTGPLATPLLAGTLTEPPDDSKGYVRQTTGASSTWVPPALPPAGPDFGLGLSHDETQTPPVVNLQPAGDSALTLGGVYVVDRVRNVSEGLELGIDGRLRAPLATDSLAGTLLEPPPDDRGYVRARSAAGVSAWVPPADTPLPDFGVGLSKDETATPPMVNLQPAGDSPATLGGVYVIDRVRNNTEGLELGIDGKLRVPPATDSLLGGLLEPPLDDKGYVRTYKGGVGAWVPPADTPLPDFGTGLSLDDGATPTDSKIVNLTPAGDGPTFLGGVYVVDRVRNISEGLELGIDGRLRVPPATDSLFGGILEPPPDDKGYVRRRTAAGESAWVPPADTPIKIAGDAANELGVIYVPDARGIALNPDGAIYLVPTTPSQIGGIVDAPFSDPADLKSYARQNAAWVEVQSDRILVAGDNPGQKGIVYVPDAMGLALGGDGRLTLAPTTPSQIGGIIDAPFSDPATPKAYVRQNAAWVEATAATSKEYGVGLLESLDKTRVDLKIAGLNDEIGGVRTFARGPTNGLEFDNQTGTISVPLATDRLPGAMVEPDGAMGGQFVRTFDGTTGAWVPVTSSAVLVSDTPPATPTPNTLWWDSDSGNLFVAYQDVDSTQWVQINTAAPPTTGIADAPNDGQPYNRQSGGWTVDTAAAATVGDVKAGFQPSDHAGWIKLDGRAVSTLTVTQQAAAATLGFTANMPDADGAVPMQSSAFGPLAQGGIAGSMSRDIVLTQANLPAVNLTAESAGAHNHLFDVREGAADKNFWGFVNDGRDVTDWAADVMIARSHAAGGTVESAPKPIFRDAGAHTHTVALGGGGTAIQFDVTPKAFAANYFCYLGA